ncbi:MAG TPA: hypothetical protein VE129_05005, partial [Thermoanaerobaculia bacterium]|nr:hypothetical protein [Thermoanaerobaculia bacterium]
MRRVRRIGSPSGFWLLALLLLPLRSVAVEEGLSPAEPETVRARWLMGTVLEMRLPAGMRN